MNEGKRAVEKVSVIVATYNRAAYLRLWLACVLAQDYADPFEVVVADDGSTDETPEVVKAAEGRRPGVDLRTCRHEHQGFRKAAIVNQAVRVSSGDLLVFLDSDCLPARDLLSVYASRFAPDTFYLGGVYFLDEAFSRRVVAAEGEPDPQRVLAEAAEPGSQRRKARRHVRSRYWRSVLYTLLGVRKPKIWGGNCAVDRRAFEAINGLDENYVGYGQEDSDLRNRLLRGGYHPVCLHTYAAAYHLWHPMNLDARRDSCGEGNNRPYYDRADVEVVCRNGLRKR